MWNGKQNIFKEGVPISVGHSARYLGSRWMVTPCPDVSTIIEIGTLKIRLWVDRKHGIVGSGGFPWEIKSGNWLALKSSKSFLSRNVLEIVLRKERREIHSVCLSGFFWSAETWCDLTHTVKRSAQEWGKACWRMSLEQVSSWQSGQLYHMRFESRSRILTVNFGSLWVGRCGDCRRRGEKSQIQDLPGRPESVQEVFIFRHFLILQSPWSVATLHYLVIHLICSVFL